MTKYRTATYIGLTPMTFLWGVTQVTDYLTRMHTAHLANVSKSVTKNATFPRTGGLPCLITHSCMSATSPTVVGGLIFCISATPHPGSLFPLFHALNRRTIDLALKSSFVAEFWWAEASYSAQHSASAINRGP